MSVVTPVIAGDAYKKPVGNMASGPAPVVVVPGAGFGAGAVGNGLGQLIVEGIGAAQQSMYEKDHANAISRISSSIPGDLSNRIRKTVARELSTNSFFRGKVRDGSPNRLVVSINSYGFVRAGKADGNILMAPQIIGSFELIDRNGKELLRQPLIGVANAKGRPLEDFANDRKLASAAFDEAIHYMALQISAAVDLKAR